MRAWSGALLAGAAWLAGTGAAMAQAPSFPSALEREPLLIWLQRETDILPDRVVAVTPQAITSIVSTFPAAAGQGPRVVIRAEALSAETYARTGALSWHVSLTADCQGRRVRLAETTGYPQRNLLGERKALRPAETEWRTPEAGTALDSAWRAACERDFKGPFQSPAVKLAGVDNLSPGAAAAPAPARPAQPAPQAAPTAPPPTPVPPPKPTPAPRPAQPSPVKPTVAPSAAPRAGGPVVQVGAAPSAADAKALLAALGGKVAGHSTAVESAVVDGRTWYRAVVGGFGDAAEAARFCADLKAAGRACFVRPARPAST